jgi:hypothetical protein
VQIESMRGEPVLERNSICTNPCEGDNLPNAQCSRRDTSVHALPQTHLIVHPPLRQQFLMCTTLNEPPASKDHDQIRVSDRAETMSHGDSRPPTLHSLESSLYDLLRLCI